MRQSVTSVQLTATETVKTFFAVNRLSVVFRCSLVIAASWAHRHLLIATGLVETAVGVKVYVTRGEKYASSEHISVNNAEKKFLETARNSNYNRNYYSTNSASLSSSLPSFGARTNIGFAGSSPVIRFSFRPFLKKFATIPAVCAPNENPIT